MSGSRQCRTIDSTAKRNCVRPWLSPGRDRFDPVLAWHNPDPEFMNEPVDGLVNVMSPPWFDRAHYRSDSNQHWRSGDPTPALATREYDWLQLLTHPEIWAFDGTTMRETMESMLAAERDVRWQQLAEDRIDLS